MNKESIEAELKRLNDLQPFWHDIELPYGLRTISENRANRLNHNMTKWARIRDFINPQEKRILDVGCNEAFFSIEMARAGAKMVHAIDIDEHRIRKARFVLDLLQIKNIEVQQADIYTMGCADGQKYDVALALGLLHRVADPYTLIKKLTELANLVCLEWESLQDVRPIMQFWRGEYKTHNKHNTGYWKPTVSCVESILERHGFLHHYRVSDTSGRAILISANSVHPGIAEKIEQQKRCMYAPGPNLFFTLKEKFQSFHKG